MRVELLYSDGCPNWEVAEMRLTQALFTLGHDDVPIHHRHVGTPEEATVLGFTGSPMVRVDGRDPFATGSDQVGLSCRVYTTPDGLDGSPTVDQLIEVLT